MTKHRRNAAILFLLLGVFGSLVGLPGRADALTQNERWVTRIYNDFLQRPPSTNELTLRTAQLAGGTTRLAIVNSVMASTEFRTIYIGYVYDTYLGRTPTTAERNAGLTTLGAGNDYVLERDVLVTNEYFNLGEDGNDGYVANLYVDLLQRTADPSGLAYYSGRLDAGTMSRATVVSTLLRTSEAAARRVGGLAGVSACPTTVLGVPESINAGAYCLVLDRLADPSGLAYWTNHLTTPGNNLTAMWGSLASSNEYYNAS